MFLFISKLWFIVNYIKVDTLIAHAGERKVSNSQILEGGDIFCSDINRENLPDKLACQAAAKKLNYEWAEAPGPQIKFPPKCYLLISKVTVTWNPLPITKGSRNPDAHPICKGDGKYTVACKIFVILLKYHI